MYYIAVEFRKDLVAGDEADLEWPITLLTDIFCHTHSKKEGIMRRDGGFWYVDYPTIGACRRAWSARRCGSPQWNFERAMIVDDDGRLVENLT